jgi:Fe-S cluster assembly iron-binding protein IscA
VALDEPAQNEEPVNIDGVNILVAEHIRPYVDGARIDYGKRWFKGEGFTVSASELLC